MSSDEYTDDGKRRREESDEEEKQHRKVKKIFRTAVKNRDRNNKMEKVMETLQTLTEEIRELRKEQREYIEEMKDIKKENEILKQENSELRRKTDQLEERVSKIERERRRNNVVIHGLKSEDQEEDNLKVVIENFLKMKLKVDVKTKRVISLGNGYLVELNSTEDKGKIMKNKSKLRDVTEAKIFINDDMSKPERDIQAKIRTKANEERAKGKTVKIGFQKMIVDGEVWKWNSVDNAMEKYNKTENPKK